MDGLMDGLIDEVSEKQLLDSVIIVLTGVGNEAKMGFEGKFYRNFYN